MTFWIFFAIKFIMPSNLYKKSSWSVNPPPPPPLSYSVSLSLSHSPPLTSHSFSVLKMIQSQEQSALAPPSQRNSWRRWKVHIKIPPNLHDTCESSFPLRQDSTCEWYRYSPSFLFPSFPVFSSFYLCYYFISTLLIFISVIFFLFLFLFLSFIAFFSSYWFSFPVFIF